VSEIQPPKTSADICVGAAGVSAGATFRVRSLSWLRRVACGFNGLRGLLGFVSTICIFGRAARSDASVRTLTASAARVAGSEVSSCPSAPAGESELVTALREDFSFPADVTGPWDWAPLARDARMLLSDFIRPEYGSPSGGSWCGQAGSYWVSRANKSRIAVTVNSALRGVFQLALLRFQTRDQPLPVW
jgi:hypothetical protein